MPRGLAKSLTDAGPPLRCSTSLRRVESPSAWKTWSGGIWLSMYLSVLHRIGLSSGYLTVCWSVSSPSVLITLVSHATQRAITIEVLWFASVDVTKVLLAFGVAASAGGKKVGGLRPEGLACTCGRRDDDPTTDNTAQRNSTRGALALIR